MEQVKLMVKGGFVTLVLCLVVTLTVLALSEFNQRSVAQTVPQPIVTASDNGSYARLKDAVPQRDITTQRFSPLEVAQ